jgi:hypothetical protein
VVKISRLEVPGMAMGLEVYMIATKGSVRVKQAIQIPIISSKRFDGKGSLA